jgi:hypothetical protein
VIEVTLYVADNIQMLAGGKPMAVGLYADRTILVTSVELPDTSRIDPQVVETANAAAKETFGTAELFGIQSLSILLALTGLEAGKFPVTVNIISPSGRPYGSGGGDFNVIVSEFGSANVLFNFAPFLYGEFGEYKVVAKVKGEVVESGFRILKHY